MIYNAHMSVKEWSAELDGTPYTLTLERGELAISYNSPPEYHYTLSDHCSVAEFVGGKMHASVERLFGAAALADALAIARGELAK